MKFDYDFTDQADVLAFQKLAEHFACTAAEPIPDKTLKEIDPINLAEQEFNEYAQYDVRWVSDVPQAKRTWIDSFVVAFKRVRRMRTAPVTLEDWGVSTTPP